VTRLPPALATWGPELAAWPEDLVLTLEPWLLRLSAALGPARSLPARGDGPPDGFAGLTRRGPYERLLTSEWLMAEQHPEEFLRRATQGEHLFYALARQAPAGTTRTRVLFDGGPEQHGAPRIVQVALLLALARRARSAGVEFRWGVLQDPATVLREEVSEVSVLALLQGRSPLPARAPDLARWQPALALGARPRPDDLWLVGGRGMRALPAPEARRVILQEPLQEVTPGPVDVSVESPGQAQGRTLRLQLPEPQVALRLLRNPFEVPGPAGPQHHPGAAADVAFSSDGRALFARVGSGVLVRSLPMGRGTVPEPRFLSGQGRAVVGAGRIGGRDWLFLAPEGERPAQLVSFSRRGVSQGGLELRSAPAMPADVATRPLGILMAQGSRKHPERMLLDPEGRLLSLSASPDAPVLVLSYGVRALAREQAEAVFVLHRDEAQSDAHIALCAANGRRLRQGDLPRRAVIWMRRGGVIQRVLTVPEVEEDPQAFIGHGVGVACVAVRLAPGRWFCVKAHADAEVAVPFDEEVVGALAAARGAQGWGPGVVALGADRAVLHLRTAKGHQAQPLEQPALQVVVSPTHPLAAVRVAGDGLFLHDLDSGRARWLRRPEAPR
jgi:hypothetical protein